MKKQIFFTKFRKVQNTCLSPVYQIFKNEQGVAHQQVDESTLPDSIGGCLSAVERLNAQIYGQLMRVHVCVGIC